MAGAQTSRQVRLASFLSLLGLSALTLPPAALSGTAAAAPASATRASVPPASYTIEAFTQTGISAAPLAGGNLMRMMLGGQPAMGQSTTRSLELRLEAPKVVVANPTAEHRIPATLGMGAVLPLRSVTTGRGDAPSFKESELTEGKGRLLLFRGCAENASSDQPEIISLQGLSAEQRRSALAALRQLEAMPQAVDASGTWGRWPAEGVTPTVPLRGSLVGDHVVVSSYAPEMRFRVETSHDFMAPLTLRTEPAGAARRLSWQPEPTALGYQATATAMGRQEGDIVMWTSSEAARNDSWVPADLRAPEAARLVQRRVLLPPERTSCSISAQALAAMQTPMVTLTAYGDTLMLSAAKGEKPWSLSLERRSITSLPLLDGMPSQQGGDAPQEPPKRRGFNPLNLF